MIAPLPANEEERLKALHGYEILDSDPEQEFDDLTLLASHICGTPIALITLVDTDRQWFKSKVGLSANETPRDLAFCAHAILLPDVFVVEDAQADPRFAAHPHVTGEPKIRFYAGAPLVTPEGDVLGTLCVIDHVPRELSARQKTALQALSRQAVTQLNLRRSLTELERTREQYAGLVNSMDGIVWEADATTLRFTFVSPRAEHILGFPPAQWLSSTDFWAHQIHPEDRQKAVQYCVSCTGQKQDHTFEYRMLSADGRVVWVSDIATYVEEPGKPAVLRGIMLDITESKQAEARQRVEEERLLRQRNALIAFTGGGTLSGEDLTGTIRRLTEIGAKTLGVARVSLWRYNHDRTAIRCVDLYELEADRHTSGIELSGASYPAYFRALAGRDVIAADDAHRDARTCEFSENYLRPMGITSMLDAPIHLGGAAEGVLCHEHIGPPRRWTGDEETFAVAVGNLASLALEGAERKRAEESLRLLSSAVEQVKESIVITDAELDLPGPGIVFVNPAFTTMTGYAAEEAIGKTPRILQGPRTDKTVLSQLRQNLGHGEAFAGETINYRKDGTTFDLEWQIAPLRDASGKITHFVAIQRDITMRREAELEMLRAKDAAEMASRAKSEFLANMSHEIRTPMNGILGMTDLTLETELTAEQREYLGMVKTSGQSLLGLINSILDFSKIEAGKLELEAIDFSLRETLAHMLKPLVLRAEQKGIALRTEIADEVREHLIGDPLRLRQILLNFADNALKFTEHGSVIVRIAVQANSESEQCLHFSIADTGIGIPKEKQAVIFEAFSQVDGSTTRNYGGTGLGLAIALQLVEQMRGRIWIESTVGQGTTFHFTAHFTVAAEKRLLTTPSEHEPEKLAKSATVLRILLAEDNIINRALATAILAKRGHKLVQAANGREAVEAATRESFDVILMDVQMPEMDGFEATARIRETEARLGRHTRIAAMTAHAMTGDRERCLAAGMDDYLSKPLEKAALLALLERIAKDRETAPNADSRRPELQYS